MYENDNKIIELYNSGLNLSEVGEKLGIKRDMVWRRLIKNNIKRRPKFTFQTKTPIDNDFYKQVDTEFKAYFLGFAYADGCMIGKSEIRLTLSEKDKCILDEFNNYLFNGKKYLYEKKSKDFIGVTSKRKEKLYHAKKQFSFSIKNKEIFNDLINLGCIPRKTFTLKFPTFDQIPENLFHHFIRGYFDGDGCICTKKGIKKYSHVISIISSNSFIDNLSLFLNKMNIKNSIRICNKVKILYIYNKIGVLDFYNYIYNNSTFFLERKRNKFNLNYLKSYHGNNKF